VLLNCFLRRADPRTLLVAQADPHTPALLVIQIAS
jgi:hypothetical protein